MSSPYRLLGRTLFPLLKRRINKISGLENLPKSGGFIIVANHQSWIDSPMVAAAIYQHIPASLRFVAQSSKYRFLGGIPIDEYDKSRVLEIIYGYLQAGHPVVIFPEGNSNKNPELRTGKTGAARLALRSGAPVVPAGIIGTTGVKTWQAAWWLIKWWQPCQIIFGQPLIFTAKNLTGEDDAVLEETTKNIMLRISQLSGKAYNPVSPFSRLEPTRGFLEKILWRVLFPLLRWRVNVTGAEYLPSDRPFIVAGNHTSYFDPAALMIALMKSGRPHPFFLTKESIARVWRRILGRNAWAGLGMLPIDNKDKTKVMRAAVEHLKQGGVLGIFPEGTRNKPSLNPKWQTELLKAKTGLARMVIKTGLPVIPAGISTPPGHGLGQTLLNILIFWRPVNVTFGPPIDFGQLPSGEPTHQQLEELSRIAMKRIATLSRMIYPY